MSAWESFNDALTPSIQGQVKLRKLAGLFAGMNQMQPLLLATTNSNYLLDRFCMERCCSSEYVSRIVTSLIFMEVMATLLVACFGVYIACTKSSNLSGQDLNNWNQNEEWYRGIVGSAIQFIIFLGYFQIFYAFTSGGKKGHMHWFYSSLLFQQFVCLLIGGAIGFWEGGVTLWYLMAIPMGPIPVFFYQLMIHSWIRNNGPSYPEYIIVEWQIGLALCISTLATLYWTAGYFISYVPIELDLTNPTGSSNTHITQKEIKSVKVYSIPVKVATDSGPAVKVIIDSITLTLTGTVTIESVTVVTVQYLNSEITVPVVYNKSDGGSVTDKSVTLPVKPEITVNSRGTNITIIVQSEVSVTIKSITLKANVKLTAQSGSAAGSVPNRPGVTKVTKMHLALDNASTTLTITVQEAVEAAQETGNDAVQAVGTACYPDPGYYIFSVVDSGTAKDIWAAGGGKCTLAIFYPKTDPKLVILYFHISGTLEKKYFGRDTAGKDSTTWRTIADVTKFRETLLTLSAPLSYLPGTATPQYNRDFDKVLWHNWDWKKPTATWAPLVMHGMAVGSFGSIFPNLIPRTLVCPRTSRTLSVVSIFLSPVPHIINLALAENDLLSSIGTGAPWEGGIHTVWSLYILYGLAFLFAIFNVHSPEWKLCCYIRSHGWMPFMMTLSITLIIEILIAIARAGIMTQRSAKDATGGGQGKLLNHPLLWNKMACLMSLSYLPFWLTTTPMMKSYVSSLDPFLCDKDRDHWPTARYGRMKSFGYWCKCACRGLYNSPRKLVTLNMRKALTRKDPKVYFLVTHDIPPED